MRLRRSVNYTPEQRERARSENRYLATIDISGPGRGHLTIQGVVSPFFAKEIRRLINRMSRQDKDEA